MAKNSNQLALIEDERIDHIPSEFALTDDILRIWADLPENERHWETMVDVVNALNEITGRHSELKKKTILALVEAKLRNESARSVFENPEYCNESTWHKRWKKDPLIMRVYEFVLSAATTFNGASEAVQILTAKRYIQNMTPLAAQILGRKILSKDESIALRAALAILKMTKTFEDDGPAVVINNSATADAASEQNGMTYDEWREVMEGNREEVTEAVAVSMAFKNLDAARNDEDEDEDEDDDDED